MNRLIEPSLGNERHANSRPIPRRLNCVCYDGRVVKRWGALVAVIVVAVLALGAPLAMASSSCMAMGAMCEGPCGASSCVTAPLVSEVAFDQAPLAATPWAVHVPSAPLTVHKRPPKSAPSFV